MQIDAAFYGEDYTAWTVLKKIDGKYYAYGQAKRKHVQDCYADIMADYERFNCAKTYMEDNADKGMVAKELRGLGMRVVTYHESMNKYLKIVTHLKSVWKDVVFVDGTGEDYIRQITDYYEDAEHDDAPDSLASLARLCYNKREYQPIYMR
jgi:predicted phage terminase large subunit-like protein